MTCLKFPASLLTVILFSQLTYFGANADDMYFWAEEVGGDVIIYHQGSIDLAGFPSPGSTNAEAYIYPSLGALINGGLPLHNIEGYNVLPYDPNRKFGSGLGTAATSDSGSDFGLLENVLFLPPGYISGTTINGSMTFAGETFDSLGFEPTPITLSTVVGSNTLFLFSPPPAVPDISETLEKGLLTKIKKLKSKSKKLRKKGKKRKAKRLLKKLKKLKKEFKSLS